MPVSTQQELENAAAELNDKKLFYTGIFFDLNDGIGQNVTKDVSYTIRMDVDNTPKTIENRNRFWFPGPEGSFAQDMRYHRGFIEMQYAIDAGIIKWFKKQQFDRQKKPEAEKKPDPISDWDLTGWFDDDDDGDDKEETNDDKPKVEIDFGPREKTNASITTNAPFDDDVEDFLNFEDGSTVSPVAARNRSRRSPQLGGLLSMLTGKGSVQKVSAATFEIDAMKVYTKMFPYPKYRNDDFKKGLYLSQAVQMTFFFGLLVQIAAAVRHRVWMKESGNRRVSRYCRGTNVSI